MAAQIASINRGDQIGSTPANPATYRGLYGVGVGLTVGIGGVGVGVGVGVGPVRTVNTALLLVMLPLMSLTITAKSAPLSSAVVGGVM